MSTPFIVGMLARPKEFRHSWSAAGTTLAVTVFATTVTVLAYTATEGNTLANTIGAAGQLALLALVGLAFLSLRCLVVPNGPWRHIPTQARMRRVGRWTFGLEHRDELAAALATGDPSMFLPLPQPTVDGPLWVEIWSADDERRAWAQVVWNPGTRSQQSAPFIEIAGDDWRTLIEAEARARGEFD